MSIHQTLVAGYTNPMIACDSADFDGTNDYMTRGAGLTGEADSKSGIFSGWARLDGGDASIMFIFASATAVGGSSLQCSLRRNASNQLEISLENAAGTPILVAQTTNTFTSAATWLHILWSWNLAASTHALYVNDASQSFGLNSVTDDTIDYTNADWAVGAIPSGGNKFNGCLAEIYFAPGQYLDFSNTYNRRKFISVSGKPVHLGTTGALPTGTAPLVYFHLDDGEAVANFATNRGTGGNFSITGTLATGSTSPSD